MRNARNMTLEYLDDAEGQLRATYYYAYLNDDDIVESIVTLPSVINLPSYILIPEYDESLIGKRYNRETGEFEDVPVSDLEELEKKVEEIKTDLTGHKTDKSNPHTVTKSQIGLGNVDNTSDASKPISTAVQTALNTTNSKVATLENTALGGYKLRFRIENNERIYTAGQGKKLTFTFDTGIPGYFPKMIRLVNTSGEDDILVADIYMVRDKDGNIVNRYVDKTYYGVPMSAVGTAAKKYVKHNVKADDRDVFRVGKEKNIVYDEGGASFFTSMNNIANEEDGYVGRFEYNENSLSFNLWVSDGLDGHYSKIKMWTYVY